MCVGRYKWHTCMCRIHKDAQQNKYSIGIYIYISCHTSVCILSISNILHFQPPQILRDIIRKRSEQHIIVLKVVSSKTT